ncbi:MAG TPA: hypothetical protein ENO14_00530, partial [Chromatiales bacterium]|nr:hypothetical protein [Chromatiales bacterium]
MTSTHEYGWVVVLLVGLCCLSSERTYAQETDSIHGSALVAPPLIARLLNPFHGPLDSTFVAEVLDEEADWRDIVGRVDESLLEARLWFRAEVHTRALAQLNAIPTAETDPIVLLERARILLESDSARMAGVEAWWSACEQNDDRTRIEIAWDILPLTTPEERKRWKEVEPGEPTCTWLRTFWNERAQRMAITADERLALHYRRLAHAREWYWIPRPYSLKGTSQFHGRPEGLAMDDRGLIFVRMGHPITDEGFTSSAAGEAAAGREVLSINDAESSESLLDQRPDATGRCWPYWRPGGYRIFCFYDGRLGGLVPGAPGTRWFQKYVVNSNLPETVIRHRIRSVRIPGGGLEEPWERALDQVENRGWERH